MALLVCAFRRIDRIKQTNVNDSHAKLQRLYFNFQIKRLRSNIPHGVLIACFSLLFSVNVAISWPKMAPK